MSLCRFTCATVSLIRYYLYASPPLSLNLQISQVSSRTLKHNFEKPLQGLLSNSNLTHNPNSSLFYVSPQPRQWETRTIAARLHDRLLPRQNLQLLQRQCPSSCPHLLPNAQTRIVRSDNATTIPPTSSGSPNSPLWFRRNMPPWTKLWRPRNTPKLVSPGNGSWTFTRSTGYPPRLPRTDYLPSLHRHRNDVGTRTVR